MRTRSKGGQQLGAATSEVTDLAALPPEVRDRSVSSLALYSYAGALTACLPSCKCLPGFSEFARLQARPAVHCMCDAQRLLARQVLANVVANLPQCEAIRLQRVSR